jgi:DnaJ-class molecular chaperone
MTHKLYEQLGISQNASPDEIKKAYRKAAIQHHPDKGGNEEKFKEITNAYEILSDEGKRNQYDQLGDDNYQNMANGSGGGGGGGGGGFPGGMSAHDIFAQMFGGMNMGGGGGGMPGDMNFDMHFGHGGGGGGQRNRRRQDHSHGMHISLNEVYTGVRKTLQICVQKACLTCKQTCSTCQGRGQITNMVRNGIFTQVINQHCGNCSGTGIMTKPQEGCGECKGRGQYNEDKRVELDIPAGVVNGHQIRIAGLGEQKQTTEEVPGDLILHIQVNEHPTFTRHGNDLHYTKTISFTESVVGVQFTIDHFSGSVSVNTLNFGIIQPGKKYEVSGKGLPYDNNKQRYGNLHIEFKITYPTKKFTNDEVYVLQKAFSSVNLN